MPVYQSKIFIPVLSLLLVSGVTACKSKKTETTTTTARGQAGRPNNLRAEVYVVKAEVFQNDYKASGTLLPNEEIEIHPEISGRVTSISFKEGAHVRKGQTLVQLYDADTRAQIQKLRAQRQLQVKLLERQQELLSIGGISRQEYETTQTQIRSIDADIAFAEAQLRTTRIVAPFNGTIGLRNISVGAVITPTTVIATLQQTNPLKMDFAVPDKYRGLLFTGKGVFFSVNNNQLGNLSGKISAIEPGADVTTRTVKVRALVPNSSGKLVPGSFAEVVIPFESNYSAILIPSNAVIPTTRDKKVAVVEQGRAQLLTVELGERTSDKVEVTKGLEAGDTVIVTGLMQVKAGMEVKVTKVRN
ncbi:efflux RND transporter periplasmic adaptor subunit [Polluticoccus soli]|uniref:efflux RND transporter periplasmic adaptor subunit n=1 Tax=Polluticoccus soli TaxID=3034150 RepID=UPI0023E094BF|nr:efflux RND transporter periplasmic adaptor subunit [Flavipsychrobacter sp. JY13-12]